MVSIVEMARIGTDTNVSVCVARNEGSSNALENLAITESAYTVTFPGEDISPMVWTSTLDFHAKVRGTKHNVRESILTFSWLKILR